MSNIKFSQLPNLANITANTIVPVVANNQNFTVTATTLQTYINSTTGNVTFGNISTTGNVTGNYFIGNGSLLTGLAATYSNANVSSYLASGLNDANIVTQANVAGAFIVGDGSALTNVNLAGLDGYTGNITGGNISVAGNITGNIRNATGGYGNADVQQVLQTYSGTFTAATVSTTGNITGNFLFGNGSQLSGINAQGNYSNANVAAFLPTYSGNIGAGNISAAGNIVAVRYSGDGSGLTNLPAGILAGNLTGNIAGNGFGITSVTTLTSSGNITGANITGTHFGSGVNLTGIIANIQAGAGISVSTANGVATVTNNNPTPYGNAQVTSLLAGFGSNTISTTGNITGRFVGNGATLSSIVTSIAAGSGISINATTGAVTITATGGGGGGNTVTKIASTFAIGSFGSTTETVSATVLIPAGTFVTGDVIRICAQWLNDSGTSTQRIGNIYVSPINGIPSPQSNLQIWGAFVSGTLQNYAKNELTLQVVSQTNNTRSLFGPNSVNTFNNATATGLGESPAGQIRTITNINWSQNQYIVFTGRSSSIQGTDGLANAGYQIYKE